MLKALVDFLLNRKGNPAPAQEAAPEAPYKVEAPQAPKCGCGRSQSGFCVGLHKLTEAEWAVHADNPNKASSQEGSCHSNQGRKTGYRKEAGQATCQKSR